MKRFVYKNLQFSQVISYQTHLDHMATLGCLNYYYDLNENPQSNVQS